jgi:ACR3 family arsenite efflux pump ArsB
VLTAIKLLHTLVWAAFVACILGIFFATRAGRLGLAAVLIGVVMCETLVLVFNRMRCPLTDVAARYTSERADNFDIYLPLFVARHNKTIFGGLYLAGIVYALVKWSAE